MIIHHNNPAWSQPPCPFAHIRGVTLVVDPSLAAHQWRHDGGRVRDIGEGIGAQVRKLAQAQAVATTATQATLF